MQKRCSFEGCESRVSNKHTECKEHFKLLQRLEIAFEDDSPPNDKLGGVSHEVRVLQYLLKNGTLIIG